MLMQKRPLLTFCVNKKRKRNEAEPSFVGSELLPFIRVFVTNMKLKFGADKIHLEHITFKELNVRYRSLLWLHAGVQKALTTAETCQLLCSEKPATFFPKEETTSFSYFVKKKVIINIIKYK